MTGETISHYRILAKIGAGGMGEVYQARDTHLGGDVALKVLLEAFTRDPQGMARFERAAVDILRRHPAIQRYAHAHHLVLLSGRDQMAW